MLRIERLETIDGRTMPGFFVRDGANKVVAIGAFSCEPFVMPSRKRYARDLNLCEAISRLTQVPIKWNLTMYGNHVTSHNRQDLMRRIRRAR